MRGIGGKSHGHLKKNTFRPSDTFLKEGHPNNTIIHGDTMVTATQNNIL